ncbi:MAG: hypothetical protein DRP94_07835 [Candidatus Latescibacterota bacterium]|nr:MAG: hypothetical protein DRP94_07835 [Candidatus Latescibacterota bacterium]RKY73597.1 MAG: hypothetical protein DRQ14_03790 [Candidatus Latescibacterota bacterium]
MRALLVTNDFPPIVSGISTYFYQLWRHLPPEKVLVLAPWVEGCEEFDRRQSFKIVRKEMPVGKSRKEKVIKTSLNIFWALYLALRFRVTKLHCGQVVSAGLAGLTCKKLLGIPYAVYVYGSETVRFSRSKFLSRLIGRITEEAEEVVPNSDFTLEEYLRFGVPREKMVKITPGVDPEAFAPRGKPLEIVRRYGLDGPTLLTVGRLDERKGHDVVINALPKVAERFPKVKYLVVGKGREEERLKALARKVGVEDKVIFVGFVPDEELPGYYNVCDLFVLPNRETEESDYLRGDYEGFGIVFLEAGACAKPVVGGRSGGVEEAVVDGVTGLLVDPRSPEEVAGAVIELLEDRDLRERLGREGRRRAEQFDWRKLSLKLEGILT